MNPGSTTIPFYRKEKVPTIVGAFFCCPQYDVRFGKESLSGISRNHCPDRSRIYMSCFKSKNETGNLQGFYLKTGTLRTASIKNNRR
jgi:hypothetical protein